MSKFHHIGHVILASYLTMFSSLCFGWGNDGHMTVGAIADKLIRGTEAEKHVKKLLHAHETLSSVSVWADCVKGSCGKLTQEMEDFVQNNPGHHNYHYTDIPFEKTRYKSGEVGTKNDDVVQILKQCISVLKEEGGDNPHHFTEREALFLITHLVGDIHQPLHVGTAYVDKKNQFVIPATQTSVDEKSIFSTHGDNDSMLGSKSLHFYWDVDLVTQGMESAKVKTDKAYAQYLIAHIKAPKQTQGVVTSWPEQWADESLHLANKVQKKLKLGNPKIEKDRYGKAYLTWPITSPAKPSAYAKSVKADVQTALVYAGYHLAELLNAIWP
jgi:hypothetical protein